VDSVVRAAFIYLFLLLLFRIAGGRSVAQMTTFDFILTLIISEAAEGALVGNDHSVTNAVIVVCTLIGLNVALAAWKHRSEKVQHWLDGEPLLIVDNGRPLKDRMDKTRINEDDVLMAARNIHGLERMDQIKYAILEAGGGISIIPREGQAA
jgi:uncharacterized membrane protein YcaP (DUF421 family)